MEGWNLFGSKAVFQQLRKRRIMEKKDDHLEAGRHCHVRRLTPCVRCRGREWLFLEKWDLAMLPSLSDHSLAHLLEGDLFACDRINGEKMSSGWTSKESHSSSKGDARYSEDSPVYPSNMVLPIEIFGFKYNVLFPSTKDREMEAYTLIGLNSFVSPTTTTKH